VRPTGIEHLERMNRTLQRLERTVNQRLADCRAHAGDDSELSRRATRLTDRITVLNHKMRTAFEGHGRAAPSNLRRTLEELAEVDRDGAPPEFLCPISQTLMVDPVRTVDGHIYDRSALLEWFATFAQGVAPRPR
jgi:hypothetical protein